MPKRAILDHVGENVQLLLAHIPHAVAIGMRVVEVRPDEAWLTVPYAPELVGNPETGVIHGGVITTLLDNAAGTAVLVALEQATSIATLDLRIDYMKPATPKLDVIAHAHCYKMTQNIAFARLPLGSGRPDRDRGRLFHAGGEPGDAGGADARAGVVT
jgi:uncharacterized protein (TIGR00369 family)